MADDKLRQHMLELYQKFLERSPTESEIDNWNDQIDSGLLLD